MASTVKWHNGQKHPTVVTGMRNLPKKAVRWWGTAAVYLATGEKVESRWNSKGPITVEQAKLAMYEVVKDLVASIQGDEATDAHYVMQCR